MTTIQEETELTARLICFTETDPFTGNRKLYGFDEAKRLVGTVTFNEDEEWSELTDSAIELLSMSEYAIFRSVGIARRVNKKSYVPTGEGRNVMLCVGFGKEGTDFTFASTLIFEDDQDNPITTNEAEGQLRTWLTVLFLEGIERRLTK